ncbi:MAG: carbohydrate ABC transporter permease [Spirochaetia bacterium]|nr:carbohydrate ABC transporter permease [Spirochaetia bacterium]
MAGTILIILPLLWQVTISLKSSNTIFELQPSFIPKEFKISNYSEAFKGMQFLRFFKNTVYISILTLIGTLFSCSLVAFGFSRTKFKGQNFLFFILLSTLMLPSQVTLIPMYITYAKLGLINSYFPLIAPHFFGDAFYIFMLKQFFSSIPKELDESATIDGCNTFRIYWNIILPLSVPALLTVILFKFNWVWNDFVNPLIYVNDQNKYTLSLGLYIFKASEKFGPKWNYLMAAATIMMIPVFTLYAIFQKRFIEGIATTGLKG